MLNLFTRLLFDGPSCQTAEITVSVPTSIEPKDCNKKLIGYLFFLKGWLPLEIFVLVILFLLKVVAKIVIKLL